MGMWQQESFVAGREYMDAFKWYKFDSGIKRNPITGALLPEIPWGQDGTLWQGCKGHGAMRRLVFSAKHGQKVAAEIRANCDGYANLPELYIPPDLLFPKANLTIYHVDEGTDWAFTVFAGPASCEMQNHLFNAFTCKRRQVKLDVMDGAYGCVPRPTSYDEGIPPVSNAAVHEICTEWGIEIHGIYTASSRLLEHGTGSVA